VIGIGWVRTDFGVELSDAALGSSHPRRELLLVNQTLGKAVHDALQPMLQLTALDY